MKLRSLICAELRIVQSFCFQFESIYSSLIESSEDFMYVRSLKNHCSLLASYRKQWRHSTHSLSRLLSCSKLNKLKSNWIRCNNCMLWLHAITIYIFEFRTDRTRIFVQSQRHVEMNFTRSLDSSTSWFFKIVFVCFSIAFFTCRIMMLISRLLSSHVE